MTLIGLDTGGTFTDVVALTADGRIAVAKALSTPGRVQDGVFDALRRLAATLGQDLDELLAATNVLAHGTTVGLNALLTRGGARVGVITTRGFESTLFIAKANKIHDLPAEDRLAPTRWRKPDPLVRPTDVRGVAERVDAAGTVVDKLDDDQVRQAATELVAAGVDSIAVCLLWSPANPAHELRVRELVAEIAPGVRTTLSHEVSARIGEYERLTTAVVEAYIAPLVSAYLARLEEDLRAHSFTGAFVVLRMGGGVQPASVARQHPVQTLRSGPAGGLAACQFLAARDGYDDVIATDVGGTSFDVGLLVAGQPRYAERPTVDRLPLATDAVDIESIGTGGGSIAWLDPRLGALRVGPRTAAADPGPACYGRGGTHPTLTDAAVALGYIDRLGSALTLDRPAALAAIEREIAEPMGLSVEAAAEGIVRVACEQLHDLIRRSTVQRGHDPAGFTLVAYGGAGPQFVGRYATGLRLRRVVIPALAAGLSAFGGLASDIRVRKDQDVRPRPVAECDDLVAEVTAGLERDVRAQLAEAGGGLVVTRTLGLRYYRQLHRLDLPVPLGPLDHQGILDEFRNRYEASVGVGSAPSNTPVELVNIGVQAARPGSVPAAVRPSRTQVAPIGHRRARFSEAWVETPVYRWDEVGTGQRIDGPAFVETDTTTAVVYPGQTAVLTGHGDLELRVE